MTTQHDVQQLSPADISMRSILLQVRKHHGLTDSEITITTGLSTAWVEQYRRELVLLDVLYDAGFYRDDEPVWRAARSRSA